MTRTQVALVVGGTGGIGREIAAQLVTEGVDVTVVGRNRDTGPTTAARIGATFLAADVSLMADVRRVAEEFAGTHDRLDLLVHTADVIPMSRRDTAEGLEVSFATNYLSRFLLNGLLLPLLRTAGADGGARVVHVAAAQGSGRLNLEKVPPGPGVGGFAAHGAGQGANDLYGVELAERLAGTGIGVHVLNPGGVDTGIRREIDATVLGKALTTVFGLLLTVRTPEESARRILASVRAHPDAVLIGAKGTPLRLRPRILDPERRRELWRRSERAVGVVDLGSMVPFPPESGRNVPMLPRSRGESAD